MQSFLSTNRFRYTPSQMQRKGVCVAIALSILTLCAAPAAAQITVEGLTGNAVSEAGGPHYQDVEDAIKKFVGRDIDGARKLLEEARNKNPKLAPAEIMMAQMLFAANQVGAARAELERAVKNAPQDPEAYLFLGEIDLQEGRVTAASLLLNKASEVTNAFKENPKRLQNFKIRTYAGLASVDESLDRWKEAKANLANWVKVDNESANPHQRLGRVLFQLKEYKDAYIEFQAAAKADDKVPPVDITMANLYWNVGDKAKAEQFIDRAVKGGGKDLRTQLALAQSLTTMNRLSDAQKHADEAVKLNPKSTEAKIAAGTLARMQGDYKAAEKLLDSAHQQSPSNFAASNQLALVLSEGDDASKLRALEFAVVNVRQNPKNIEALATVGWANFKLGRIKEAEEALTSVANSGGVTADSAYFLANLLAGEGRKSDAQQVLEHALETDRPFTYRKQAQGLLVSLKSSKDDGKKGGAAKKGNDKGDSTKASKSED